jgi:hypothetical protein
MDRHLGIAAIDWRIEVAALDDRHLSIVRRSFGPPPITSSAAEFALRDG